MPALLLSGGGGAAAAVFFSRRPPPLNFSCRIRRRFPPPPAAAGDAFFPLPSSIDFSRCPADGSLTIKLTSRRPPQSDDDDDEAEEEEGAVRLARELMAQAVRAQLMGKAEGEEEEGEVVGEVEVRLGREATERAMGRAARMAGAPLALLAASSPLCSHLLRAGRPPAWPFVAAAVAGYVYGALSASWDPHRRGSPLGWGEALRNCRRLRELRYACYTHLLGPDVVRSDSLLRVDAAFLYYLHALVINLVLKSLDNSITNLERRTLSQ